MRSADCSPGVAVRGSARILCGLGPDRPDGLKGEGLYRYPGRTRHRSRSPRIRSQHRRLEMPRNTLRGYGVNCTASCYPTSSLSLAMLCSSTLALASMSVGLAHSPGQWLIPAWFGTNIIPMSAYLAILNASCPAWLMTRL